MSITFSVLSKNFQIKHLLVEFLLADTVTACVLFSNNTFFHCSMQKIPQQRPSLEALMVLYLLSL